MNAGGAKPTFSCLMGLAGATSVAAHPAHGGETSVISVETARQGLKPQNNSNRNDP